MEFLVEPPRPALEKVVDFYWQCIFDKKSDLQKYQPQLPAMANQEIVFNLDTPYAIEWFGGGKTEVPQSCLTGHFTEPLSLINISSAFSIRLKHSAIYKLWGFPVSEFNNRPMGLEDILGRAANDWVEQIHEAGSFLERVSISDNYLLHYLQQSKRKIERVDWATSTIQHSSTHTSVKGLTEKAGCSSRQLHREFLQKIGLAPKAYLGIARTKHLIMCINSNLDCDWHDLTYRFNFFDQPHFIRGFKKHTGFTPKTFFENQLHRYSQVIFRSQEVVD